MKKTSIFLMAVLAASWVGAWVNQAQAGQSPRIQRFQAEARRAELDAQAAARSQAAYEQAWRDTKKAARDAYDRTQLLRSPTPVGVLEYLWDKPVQKFERKPPAHYQSLPRIRAPEIRDFRNLVPRR